MKGPHSDPSEYEDLNSQLEAREEAETSRDSRHLLSMFLNFTLWLMAVVFCASLVGSAAANSSFFEDDFLVKFSLAMLFVYGLYVAETLTSETFKTLFWATSPHKLHSYIAFIREREPQILLRCKTYSFQDRFDRIFDAPMRKRLDWGFYQREFDFRKVMGETREFRFEEVSTEDQSDGTGAVDRNTPFVNVKFDYRIDFNDQKLLELYRKWRVDCQREAYGTDAFVEMEDVRRLPGMIKGMKIKNEKNGNVATHWTIFVLVSVVFMISWPYRLWVDEKIGEQNFRIHKTLVPKISGPSNSLDIIT
jgi:hypothetical protein